MNDLENKLAFPAVRETIILRYQVSFFLCTYMCSCSEIEMGFANTYGKKFRSKSFKGYHTWFTKMLFKLQGCTVNYIYQDIFCHPNRIQDRCTLGQISGRKLYFISTTFFQMDVLCY